MTVEIISEWRDVSEYGEPPDGAEVIVRCRDCVYHDKFSMHAKALGRTFVTEWCRFLNIDVDGSDYCAWGTRKDGE